MNNSIIAYNIVELEKKEVLSKAEILYKSQLLNEEQWDKIKTEFASKLYTPSIFMKLLLFIFSLIGMTTVIGPIGAMFGDLGELGYRILSFFLGILILFITERILIKNKSHFKSGITEAGIYSGLSFIAFGTIGFDPQNLIICAIIGLALTTFAAIRYLNLLALVSAIGFFGWIIFQIITSIGGTIEALMPFIFMVTFGLIYWFSNKLQEKLPQVIFNNHFVVVKAISLLLFYSAGNYFVVRELSTSLMGLNLSEQDEIPFAIVFYLLTALVPIGYLYWGIKNKSILFIRVGLTILALSIVTFKYYFSLGIPMVTVTVSGAILIGIALVLFNYLKLIRSGFTRELLLRDNWNTRDLAAIIASQTLGGNRTMSSDNDVIFKGGSFGGAGAGGNW